MPHVIYGSGSLVRRPDTISSDFQFAHTFGPIQISDFTQGLYVRVWRARADVATETIYLCRNNATNDAWEAETALFSYAGPPILELDVAFDQQGRVFVCAERATGVAGASQIWAYYFNGLVGNYVFEAVGSGRTPKCLLDDTFDTVNADVLLFYMNDAVGMCWRLQRDRYTIEHTVVLAASPEPVDINGGNQSAPVGPLHWEFAPGIYVQPRTGTFLFQHCHDVPGHTIYAEAKGAYVPFPPTMIGGKRAGMYGYMLPTDPEEGVQVFFDPPVTGVEVTAIGAHFDGATMWAFAGPAPYANYLGQVSFPKEEPGTHDPEVRRGIFFPSIAQISLLPSATDPTIWKDINIRLAAPAQPIPLPPGFPPPANLTYIEDLYKATDGRVHILYSLRDIAKGQYNLFHYETLLYPIVDRDPGSIVAFARIASGDLHIILISKTIDPESISASAYIAAGGDLHDLLIEITLYDPESISASGAIGPGGTLVLAGPILHTLFDKEAIKASASIAPGGTLRVSLIQHTLFDIEALKASASIAAGGTLV